MSVLARESAFQGRIGTGNDQGINREWESLVAGFLLGTSAILPDGLLAQLRAVLTTVGFEKLFAPRAVP
jgi:hypothetical protein